MGLKNYVSVLLRHLKELVAIVLIVVIAGYISARQIVQPTFSATVFVSVGVDRMENDEGRYGGMQAADAFSETIQGWTKDPGFLNRVREASGNRNLDISSRKQERQNVVITVTGGESEEGIRSDAEAVLTVLKSSLANFNALTKGSYQIGLESITTQVTVPSDSTKLNVALALIFGLVFGVLWAYLYEFIMGRISYAHQVSRILGARVKGILELNGSRESLDVLRAFLDKTGGKKIFMGVSFEPTTFRKGLDLPSDSVCVFPGGAEILTHGGETVAIVKLGVSKEADLKQLAFLVDGDCYVVVI